VANFTQVSDTVYNPQYQTAPLFFYHDAIMAPAS